jgi:voltage-gated potassium channel
MRPLPIARDPTTRRLGASVLVLVVVWVLGALGLHTLGRGAWSVSECVYQTAITIFTVGFSELPNTDQVAGARGFTTVLIVLGVAAVAYVQANVTTMLVEGTLGDVFRRNRMQKEIDKLREHIVVAGCGSTGRYVVGELHATRRAFVVIDRSEERLREISTEVCNGEMRFVVGDATHDHALLAAGIERASGVVAALTDDADNLYVTLSARALNAHARIVSKAVASEAEAKMRRAGASAVVSPNTIGGKRMASELLRPQVVEFLDQMQRHDHSLRIEDVRIPDRSSLVGKLLRDAALRPRTKALVIAIREPDGAFHYNPGPETRIGAGLTLIIMGDANDLETVRAIVSDR